MNRLTLIQLNDSHGYLEPHPELIWEADGPILHQMGGFARIASVLATARTENPGGVLAFDNGDTFHGTPALAKTQGECAVPVLNALGLTAMTGHWDFAYGPRQLARLSEMLNYPMLAANCHPLTADAPRFAPTLIAESAGCRIGVIGLAATILDKTMPSSFSEGLRFTDGIEETRDHASRLRAEGCDLIVVLSHLGLPQDHALATAVRGLDVILSGHTHNRLDRPWAVNGALLIQSGCHGSFLGRLDLDLEGGKVLAHRHRLIPIDDAIRPDATVADLVTRAVAPTAALRNDIVGHSADLLHRMTCLDAPMDDVLLAAIAEAAGTRIAFSNGWRYGVPIPPGPVSAYDLWCIVPTDPPIETVCLSGAEILEMMEQNLEATFSADPFHQRGGYVKRFRGLAFTVKLENPPLHRIEMAFGPDGTPLDAQGVYRCAFITTQGVPHRFGKDRRAIGISAIKALRSWFACHDRAGPAHLGRLRIV